MDPCIKWVHDGQVGQIENVPLDSSLTHGITMHLLHKIFLLPTTHQSLVIHLFLVADME
jgi:hypothetical protein